MIPDSFDNYGKNWCKPRASGDDPLRRFEITDDLA